jgi:hypothetical protein
MNRMQTKSGMGGFTATNGLAGAAAVRQAGPLCHACKLGHHGKHTPKARGPMRGFVKCECRKCA